MTVQLRRWKTRFIGKERTKFDMLEVHELGKALKLDEGYNQLRQLRNELLDGGMVMLTSHKFAVIVEKAIAAHRIWRATE